MINVHGHRKKKTNRNKTRKLSKTAQTAQQRSVQDVK